MKILFRLLCGAALAGLISMPVSAQEVAAEEAAEKAVEKPAVETTAPKKKTNPFMAGEIVVREKSIAAIDDASTTTEITDAEIEARRDKTLYDSIGMVPGVTTYQSQKGSSSFDMRGFSSDKLAILVDGIPFEEVYYGGGGDMARISVLNVSKIVVNRGVTSALYGTLGMLGTVNVVTKRPEKLFAKLDTEYGQFDNYTISVAQGAALGKFYCWVTASIQNSGGYEISNRLTWQKRMDMFNRFCQYWMYGKTLNDIWLQSAFHYLNDRGRWDHADYRRYSLGAKAGYNFTDKVEAGVSVQYYSSTQHFNAYYPNTLPTYDPGSSGGPAFKTPSGSAYNTDGRSSIFVNQYFNWVYDYRYTIAPYVRAELGDFMLLGNLFFMRQYNDLNSYFNQNRSITFPPSLYNYSSFSVSMPWAARPYSSDTVHSIFDDNAYGFYLIPSYKLGTWNKLSMAFNGRIENHRKYEKANEDLRAPNILRLMGEDRYIVKRMQMKYATVAIEDEAKLNTPIGGLALTAGVSYDAQEMTKYRLRSNNRINNTLNQMVGGYIPRSNEDIWGTRDSFNPVAGLVYEPLKNLMKLRAAFAKKVEFPSMSTYGGVETQALDFNMKPERSYNYSAGFELTFLDGELSYRSDYFYSLFKDKIEKIWDTTKAPDDFYYSNIEGRISQGLENTVKYSRKKIFNVVDLDVSFCYVFIHSRNRDDSSLTYGDYVENTPEHQLILQLGLEFFTRTGLTVWGQHTRGMRKYVMAAPVPDGTPAYFSTVYYRAAHLHNPFMLNVKISQKIWENFELYVMCKNVLDDYNADAFSPGPGRMFYFGGSAQL